MAKKQCNCNRQIVWFFDGKSTIVACEKCQITFHYKVERCPHCYEPVTIFEKKGD